MTNNNNNNNNDNDDRKATETPVPESVSESVYEEIWTPPIAPFVFFLPMFYKYGVIIAKTNNTSTTNNEDEHGNGNDNENESDDLQQLQLTFGYGFSRPWDALSAKTVPIRTIDKDSITIGTASWKDNFFKYGGWGIRLGLDGSTAYNAKNGDYIEFEYYVEGSGSRSGSGLDGSTAYNAKNGDYIEFEYYVEGSGSRSGSRSGSGSGSGSDKPGKRRKYRFVSNDVETVASLMRGEGVGVSVNVGGDVTSKDGDTDTDTDQ
eukprot:CAMPEP_0203711912 /NCGR_PEP_ID=MMETSP0091-20130426/69765_1 /ASSEMBLY_ACC=CAM_ASM_001089 /TAXON_ID=426623 /ORGANISM="Chaetoceros affinis, Strain CCMP159" /LENGTH=261 /DNA_ID=CAMNT_0050589865 /DNA_START=32 /DNA_END=817 /DNA_ORIENTATION=-